MSRANINVLRNTSLCVECFEFYLRKQQHLK